MSNASTFHASPSSASSPLVELRQYTLYPKQRDVLIELFEREFIETQEAVGMRVIGQFIDRDDPEKFVWLRGFADMSSRREGLAAFYDGPVWATHREAANATMIDSDNVLLLRDAASGAGFSLATERPPVGAAGNGTGVVLAEIVHLRTPDAGRAAVALFESVVAPAVADAGGSLLGYFLTERSPNDFTRLPVREDVSALVWFVGFADEPNSAALADAASALAGFSRRIEHLTLVPTARSLLTAHTPPCAGAAQTP